MQVLVEVIERLSEKERKNFADLIGRLLVGLMREPGATKWICRMCDLGACGRPEGQCPIERAAHGAYG